MNNKNGFTLIEMLVALVVTMVIMGGAYSVFNSQQKQTTIQTNVSDVQQSVRAAMDFMSRDLRMAGYDPEDIGGFGIVDIKFRDLNDSVSNTGSSFIRFLWDRDSDGFLDSDETIDYGLVDSTDVTPGIADIYLRLPNDTNKRDVLSSNIISLGLAYAYDDNDDGELDRDAGTGEIIWAVDARNDDVWDSLNTATGATTVTGTAVDLGAIRAVRIWLLAQSQAQDPNYTDNTTYVVGSHVVTPNNNFRHRISERTILCRNMGI